MTILDSFQSLNKYTFNSDFNLITSSFLLLLFTISFIFVLRRRDDLRALFLFFILLILGVSLYGGPKYPHYFLIVYPFYYITLGYFLSLFLTSRLWAAVIILFFTIYIVLNNQGYYFLTANENNQIDTAKKISTVIANNVDRNEFRLTSLPQQYGDYTYRYFLEIWGKKPIEKGSLERTNILFVVCEEECKPIGDPQWDIAYFAPRKVVGMWEVDNVTIYRLTR